MHGVDRRRRSYGEQLGGEAVHALGDAIGLLIAERAQTRQHALGPVELVLESLDRAVRRSAHEIKISTGLDDASRRPRAVVESTVDCAFRPMNHCCPSRRICARMGAVVDRSREAAAHVRPRRAPGAPPLSRSSGGPQHPQMQ